MTTCTMTNSDDAGGAHEMDGARRLPPAEEIEQPREGRVHRRRHGQAGEDDQRQQARRSRRDRRASAGRCSSSPPRPWESASACAPESTARCGAAALRVGTRSRRTWPLAGCVDEIGEAVDDEQPGEEEVPAPAGGEILVARQRDPGREAARRRARRSHRATARDAGRVELSTSRSWLCRRSCRRRAGRAPCSARRVRRPTSRRNRAPDAR